MAIRIDLTKHFLTDAIEAKMAQIKRQADKENNPLIKDLHLKDISCYQAALNTMVEQK